MWIFTKRWPQQRSVLKNKWMRWPVLGVPVSFIPWPSLSSPSGFMNNVTMVAGMEVMHRSSNRALYSAWPGYSCCWVPKLLQQWPTLTPPHGTTPGSDQPRGMLITLDHFHHGRSSILFLPNRHLFLDMDLPSLHMFLPKCLWIYRIPYPPSCWST